jgi:hypothetical protein
MKAFSRDADLAGYEPGLFTGPDFAGPVLCRGSNGQVSGTAFTAAGENFVAKRVAAGHVIYLSDGLGAIDGAYEIVSVNSPTQLTLSVLRADRAGEPIAVGNGANLLYRVGTFDIRAARVMTSLTAQLGIRPGAADGVLGVENLLDAEPLREVSTLLCLEMIFTGLYQTEADEALLRKRDHYRAMARRAMTQTVVRLDLDGDGICERSLCGGYASLIRE